MNIAHFDVKNSQEAKMQARSIRVEWGNVNERLFKAD